MDSFFSKKIKFYSFVTMLLLLFVHATNPTELMSHDPTYNSFIQLFLSNGLFKFRLPMLFCISGYIFSYKDNQPNSKRLISSVRRLLIPYVVWSFFTVSFVQLYQLKTGTGYNFSNFAIKVFITPIAFQLWYLRTLFIYRICYPVFNNVLNLFPYIFFLYIILWLNNYGSYFIEGEGLLFFNLGILLHKRKVNVMVKPKWINLLVTWPLLICILIIKTTFSFKVSVGNEVLLIQLNYLHKMAVLLGLVSMWFSFDAFIVKVMAKDWFLKITNYSFILYTMHILVFIFLSRILKTFFDEYLLDNNFSFLIFIIQPLITAIICIYSGMFLKYKTPKFYNLLTGEKDYLSKKIMNIKSQSFNQVFNKSIVIKHKNRNLNKNVT